MKKSLVVGASGQIGHQLVRALGEANVVMAARIPRAGWTQIDLASLSLDPAPAERVLLEEDIGAVYCVGGATDVERCESDVSWAMETNLAGPAILAALSIQVPFVYFSTEYVFDGLEGPYTEASEVKPISVYGRSKALGESAILRAHPAALIVRTTVVYGEDPGGKNFLYSLRRNLASGMPIRVPVDQISTPTYNRDIALATISLVEGNYCGIFHVCGTDLVSRYDFAIRCARMMGLDESKIVGVSTAALGQKAARPLRAGLLTAKLHDTFREFRMRGIDSGVQDWLKSVES